MNASGMEEQIKDPEIIQESTEANPYIKEVLHDFWICCISREASKLVRREVLTGKAKFGISGDGKEVAQVAMARAFKKGDFRSGYYRDQTFMFAIGEATLEEYFAQVFADHEQDPFSGGRQMASHFATAFIDENGDWEDLPNKYNVSSDISCTAGQVNRGLGLALASKKFRDVKELKDHPLNDGGKGVSFLTIGDGSTSEGPFWEMMNAAAVMKVPLAVSVWDDGYAISVPTKYQTVKESISKAMEGFLIDENKNGIRIYTANAWDYPGLIDLYDRAINRVRDEYIPALIHVQKMTQPLGHSTSGSHERYKSRERLQWEEDHDCIDRFEDWILTNELASADELKGLRKEAVVYAKEAKNKAWKKFSDRIESKKEEFTTILREIYYANDKMEFIRLHFDKMNQLQYPNLSDIVSAARKISHGLSIKGVLHENLKKWIETEMAYMDDAICYNLYSHTPNSPFKVDEIPPVYSEDSLELNGYEILNRFFDKAFEKHSNLFGYGEDVGKLGDVNQGFAKLQEKYGEHRIFDTGIREWTIIGQATGMGMRGLRSIAEIQYLDYIVYALAPLTDDLATLRYRTDGKQFSNPIIRTRGHRLEGIWHAGSPIAMLLNSLKGIHICVPRNMVQAAGIYNTLLQSDDPAIVIEVLNGYRKKEKLPDNIGEFTVPIGQAELLKEGKDLTIVTYGACVWEAWEALDYLDEFGISVDLIDVQTLMPFDILHLIKKSVVKTNRVLFLDEDVPGGASAYMLQKAMEEQQLFDYLEIPPETLSARDNRTAYGDDGDYITKPSEDDIVMKILNMLHRVDPERYPRLL
ncbi:alpha-ketoacid dehydrogenase subunit alpha/beta [Membranihabitans maritimus]|uniref:alpha-ketoacid dehydrogenase subunit alpha/beta n=1 Tax=Membranihabitans maritimus TaxID=2904244 RepID=UPI001F0114E3|nr:alpha-ketoacid dehydrogenase subunit alpha/beta [Membranihabitans maritimus]